MKKLISAIMALVCVAAAGRLAYAADNGTEFGIEDDLTVLGYQGTALDPDVEVKGFTVFGATQAAYSGAVVGAGNVVVNGYLAVSSGAYFVGGSTFSTGGAYFTGVSSFSNVANIHIAGGTANQVLKKVAGGGMVWANDNDGGAASITGTPRRVTMIDGSGTGLVSSLFLQNGTDAGVTLMSNSSMTVTGAFEAAGAVKFNGAVTLGDASGDAITAIGAVTAQNGVAVTGGDVSVTNNLTVNGNAQLGNAVTDTHAINKAVEAGVALAVDGGGDSGNYAAKFYSNGSLAAWIKKK